MQGVPIRQKVTTRAGTGIFFRSEFFGFIFIVFAVLLCRGHAFSFVHTAYQKKQISSPTWGLYVRTACGVRVVFLNGAWSSWHLQIPCLHLIIIISLAIRQCAARSSTLITHNFPERRKPRKQKETHAPPNCLGRLLRLIHVHEYKRFLVLVSIRIVKRSFYLLRRNVACTQQKNKTWKTKEDQRTYCCTRLLQLTTVRVHTCYVLARYLQYITATFSPKIYNLLAAVLDYELYWTIARVRTFYPVRTFSIPTLPR